MFRKSLATLFAFLLIIVIGFNSAFAQDVQADIEKLGIGKSVRVEIKLHDKTKLKGYVYEAGPENFVLANPETGGLTAVGYRQVKQLRGYNLSTGKKVAVGISVSVGAFFLIWLLLASRD